MPRPGVTRELVPVAVWSEKPKRLKEIVKTSQRIERSLGLRFESCDFKSLRIGAIRSVANCAPRIGTSSAKPLATPNPARWRLEIAASRVTAISVVIPTRALTRFRSEKLEKAGTVTFEKHSARKVGTRSRQCRPKVPGRFAFPVSEILEFVAFRDSGKISSNFPVTFPEFSSRNPEQTLETTAFSSFLIRGDSACDFAGTLRFQTDCVETSNRCDCDFAIFGD